MSFAFIQWCLKYVFSHGEVSSTFVIQFSSSQSGGGPFYSGRSLGVPSRMLCFKHDYRAQEAAKDGSEVFHFLLCLCFVTLVPVVEFVVKLYDAMDKLIVVLDIFGVYENMWCF